MLPAQQACSAASIPVPTNAIQTLPAPPVTPCSQFDKQLFLLHYTINSRCSMQCPSGDTSRSGAANSTWCVKAPGKCAGLCGQANIAQPAGPACSCDWWAQNVGDACDASKDAACPGELLLLLLTACMRCSLLWLTSCSLQLCASGVYHAGQCFFEAVAMEKC